VSAIPKKGCANKQTAYTVLDQDSGHMLRFLALEQLFL
jgi:hypothetical protein